MRFLILLSVALLSLTGCNEDDPRSRQRTSSAGGSGGTTSSAGGPSTAGPTGPGAGGSTGCDGDLETDPKNCGFCAHDCLESSCTDGLCAAMKIVDAADVVDATTSGDTLYWVTPSEVRSVELGSSSPSTLATTETGSDFEGVRHLDGKLYAWDYASSMTRLYRIDPTGPVLITSTLGLTFDVATDGQWLFLSSSTLQRAPVGGGAASTLKATGTFAAAVDAGFVYYVSHGDDVIGRIRPNGTDDQILAPYSGPVSRMAIQDGYVYVASAMLDGQIERLPIDGGSLEPVAAGMLMAIAPDALYALTWPGLTRYTLDGTLVAQIAANDSSSSTFHWPSVAGSYLVFYDLGKGSFHRVAR